MPLSHAVAGSRSYYSKQAWGSASLHPRLTLCCRLLWSLSGKSVSSLSLCSLSVFCVSVVSVSVSNFSTETQRTLRLHRRNGSQIFSRQTAPQAVKYFLLTPRVKHFFWKNMLPLRGEIFQTTSSKKPPGCALPWFRVISWIVLLRFKRTTHEITRKYASQSL